MSDPVSAFLRSYGATAVGPTPPQPNIPAADESTDTPDSTDRTIECDEGDWSSMVVGEGPAAPGEYPERFVDGSHTGQPVLCLRSPHGWPIPLLLSEIGAVAMRTVDRHFEREYAIVERVLTFVVDPFPWEQVEAFADAIANKPELRLRLLPANLPKEKHNPFDYELMRMQAYNRAQQEMSNLENMAVETVRSAPTLVDGPLDHLLGVSDPAMPLLIGVTKRQFGSYLHDQGYRTLLDLRPAQRTPVFQIKRQGSPKVASWFLKLAGGPRLAPNWGHVRVEVPWKQFLRRCDIQKKDFGFVNRLSRWLIDARCRTESYARMPVSLDPIVRAEDALKPLFTPTQVLVNRLYRTAGLFRKDEP
jgi:hypothetical protein